MENYKAIIKFNNDDFDIIVDYDFAKNIHVGDILIPYDFYTKTQAPWVKEFIGADIDYEDEDIIFGEGSVRDMFPGDINYRENSGVLELKVFEREFDIDALKIWVELYYNPNAF